MSGTVAGSGLGLGGAISGPVVAMPTAIPPEFGRDVAAVARKGEAPIAQIAKDFGTSERCLHRWLKFAYAR